MRRRRETEVVPDFTEDTTGWLLENRSSWFPRPHEGLLFLPSYSPDLSPIEEAFSKLKAFLRRAQARTHETLQEAIREALATITAKACTRLVSTLWLSTCR